MKITKTAAQASFENTQRGEALSNCKMCPECGTVYKGISTVTYKTTGIFNITFLGSFFSKFIIFE